MVQPDDPLAELHDGGHVVGDEEDRAAAGPEAVEVLEALLLEVSITDREHLVDQEDLRLQVHGHREPEAHIHAGRVVLDRGVHEVAEAGELDDRVVVALHLAQPKAEQRAVELDVLAAGVLGLEARAELQERGDPPGDLDLAAVGSEDAGQHLEQGALARAVVPDHAHELALLDLEADVLERPEVLPFAPAPVGDDLLQALVAAPVAAVALGETLDREDRLRHPRPPPRSGPRAA